MTDPTTTTSNDARPTDEVGSRRWSFGPLESHRTLLFRVGAGALAVGLLATLAVLVLSGRTTARSSQAYCSRMADTTDLGDVLATGDAGDIRDAADQLAAAGRVAPPEIEPAMTRFVDYTSGLADAVGTAGKDEASLAAALQAAIIARNDQADQVAAAVHDVDGYVSTTCGFTLGPATGDQGSGAAN